MKIITYTLVLLASIAAFSSCNHLFKCEGYACVSPPPIPRFSIFNASGKNITDSTSFYIRGAGDDTKYKGTVVELRQQLFIGILCLPKQVMASKILSSL
jgi:hypothetical protein